MFGKNQILIKNKKTLFTRMSKFYGSRFFILLFIFSMRGIPALATSEINDCLKKIDSYLEKKKNVEKAVEKKEAEAQTLIRLAEIRFETEKKYHEQMMQAWVQFKQEKAKLKSEIRRKNINRAKIQNKYKEELEKLRQECLSEANEKFPEHQAQAYGTPMNDPTQLSSFSLRVHNHWDQDYKNCWRGKSRQVELLSENHRIALEEMDHNTNEAEEALRDLHQTAVQIQKGIKRNTKQQEALNRYNEGFVRKIASESKKDVDKILSLRLLGQTAGCFRYFFTDERDSGGDSGEDSSGVAI